MPADYTVTVQGIEAADKGTDPVYVYTKLIDEEQRRNSEKPQSGSNNKSEQALSASHRVNKRCYKCNRLGYIAKNCRSRGSGASNNNNNNNNNSNSNNASSGKGKGGYPPCGTCKTN